MAAIGAALKLCGYGGMMKVDPSCLTQLDPISRLAATVNWEPFIAIGTIGAVIAALWIAEEGHRQARERHRTTVLAVIGMATKLREIYSWIDDSNPGETGLWAPVHADTFHDMRTQFDGVRVVELPSRGTVEAFMEMAAVLQLSARMHDRLKPDIAALGDFANHCRDAGRTIDQVIEALEREVALVRHPVVRFFSRIRSVIGMS